MEKFILFYSGATLWADAPDAYVDEVQRILNEIAKTYEPAWEAAGLSDCAIGFGIDSMGEPKSTVRVTVGRKSSSGWIYRHVATLEEFRGDPEALRRVAAEDAAKMEEKIKGRIARANSKPVE